MRQVFSFGSARTSKQVMTKDADLTDSLPELQIKAPGNAAAKLPDDVDESVLSALIIRAMQAHADSLAEARRARTVSVSLDMTGKAFAGGEVSLRSKVDRQTRTIIFMGAELCVQGDVIQKATAIFRLTEAG